MTMAKSKTNAAPKSFDDAIDANEREAMLRELNALRAENEKLTKAKRGPRELTLKVSAKGGVSLYGIRRFPVTFYADEWPMILGMAERIVEFIAENSDDLKRKGE